MEHIDNVLRVLHQMQISSFCTMQFAPENEEPDKRTKEAIDSILRLHGGRWNTKMKNYAFANTTSLEPVFEKIKEEYPLGESTDPVAESFVPDIFDGFHLTPEQAEMMTGKVLFNQDKSKFLMIVGGSAHDYEVLHAAVKIFPSSHVIVFDDDKAKIPEIKKILEGYNTPETPTLYYTMENWDRFTDVYTKKLAAETGVTLEAEQAFVEQLFILLVPKDAVIKLEEILHAFNLLKHGGRLVTIVSNKIPNEQEIAGFTAWLESDAEYYKYIPLNDEFKLLIIDK